MSAAASDSVGSIFKVEFFNGTALLATVTQAPFCYTWSNVAAGSYSLTARATDNLGGIAATQPSVVTVAAGAAQLYYVYSDQVNAPREISNAAGVVVWRADATEPFGANMPNENPSGLGTFAYNLRFPGQYYDRETNLHYNYFRDFDPQTGRFIQSDPIGLKGGINTYAYVESNPLSKVDPLGLQSVSEPGDSSRPGRLPGPFDILTPGTPANNDFVKSVSRLIKNVKDACSSNDLPREECKKGCVSQYERDATACEVAYIGYGKPGFAVCMARAGDYLGQCMKSCDGQ